MIEKDPASFQKLLDGYFAAGEKLDKKEALRVAEEYLGQDAATLETSLDWISYQDLAISEEAIYLADRVVISMPIRGRSKQYLRFRLESTGIVRVRVFWQFGIRFLRSSI